MKSNRMAFVLAAAAAMMTTGAIADALRGVTNDTVVLGSHTDLSGPLAIWGKPSVDGARLRFEEVNANGGVNGRKIEFLVEDTGYQVPQAVRATNKLVQRDGIFAMVLGAGTAQSLAGMEITDRAGIPTLFPLTAARSMAAPTNPLHFSYFVSYQDQAAGALKYFHGKDGVGNVCLQTHSSEYGEEITEGVKETADELGMKVVLIGTHKPTETDFAGAATAIKNAGCDLVYLGTTIKDTIALYTTLRSLGFEGPIVGNMVSYIPVVAEAANGAMNGYYAVSPVLIADYHDGDKARAGFYEAYKARFGSEPTMQSQIGYVSADLLVKAMEAAGRDLTVEGVTEALENIKGYEDPFGGPTISFGPNKRFGGDSLVLVQVDGTDWKLLQESLPY